VPVSCRQVFLPLRRNGIRCARPGAMPGDENPKADLNAAATVMAPRYPARLRGHRLVTCVSQPDEL
jgi:hypothetical protein